jgi:hypothetical protein
MTFRVAAAERRRVSAEHRTRIDWVKLAGITGCVVFCAGCWWGVVWLIQKALA